MKFKQIYSAIFISVALIIFSTSPVLADDEGVALASDWTASWYWDLQAFSDIIDSYSGWNEYFISWDPIAEWWQEESDGGDDDSYADYTELSLIQSHSVDLGDGLIGVGFGPSEYTGPDEVRLGYASPDDSGYNIFWFVMECSVLQTDSYGEWKAILAGTNMMIGFKNDAVLTDADLEELACRLTGTGGYSKRKVKSAFSYTYMTEDGTHNDNIGRLIGENSTVLSDDYVDVYDSDVTVDSSKTISTLY